jgi:transposase
MPEKRSGKRISGNVKAEKREQADRMRYPSDLEAAHWEQMAHHFALRDRRGSGHKHTKKQLVDGILHVARTGCQWRQLPTDCPPWKTGYDHFRKWNLRGVWA